MPSRNLKRKQRVQPALAPKPKPPEELNPLQWISSDSEPEDYGDLGGQEHWSVDGIIDSHLGENDRMSYKLQWDKNGWCRPDGTSQEWIPEPKPNDLQHRGLIRKYEAREYLHFNQQPHPDIVEEDNYPHFGSGPATNKNWWHQTHARWCFHQHALKTGGDYRLAGISELEIDDSAFARGEFDSDSDDERASPASEVKQEPGTGAEPRLSSSPSVGGLKYPEKGIKSEWMT